MNLGRVGTIFLSSVFGLAAVRGPALPAGDDLNPEEPAQLSKLKEAGFRAPSTFQEADEGLYWELIHHRASYISKLLFELSVRMKDNAKLQKTNPLELSKSIDKNSGKLSQIGLAFKEEHIPVLDKLITDTEKGAVIVERFLPKINPRKLLFDTSDSEKTFHRSFNDFALVNSVQGHQNSTLRLKGFQDSFLRKKRDDDQSSFGFTIQNVSSLRPIKSISLDSNGDGFEGPGIRKSETLSTWLGKAKQAQDDQSRKWSEQILKMHGLKK